MTLREMWDQGHFLFRSFFIHHTHTHTIYSEKSYQYHRGSEM